MAQKSVEQVMMAKKDDGQALPALSRRIFEKYDADGSGFIDRNEFKAMCYDLGHYLTDAETDIAFRTIDLDGKGTISYDEFYKFWRTDKRFEKLHLPEAELKRLEAAVAYFQYFDKDKSGQLDKGEFAQLHADLVKNKMTTHSLDECFQELDTDNSAVIGASFDGCRSRLSHNEASLAASCGRCTRNAVPGVTKYARQS